ncbi:hypothetical protein C1645_789120 [Glomus cerebriforme]|uniref:Uncharacterized protein n=1 Tax=Glomus cerebriforme TaxID=658196 RepID=A0A397SB31_9GLOM|nr:hypothetical protein C1645_789120 [Glomus cerebriforme]
MHISKKERFCFFIQVFDHVIWSLYLDDKNSQNSKILHDKKKFIISRATLSS